MTISRGIHADLPGGPPLSDDETTFRWFADPLRLLDDCAIELGDRFTLRFNRFGSHVVVSRPDDVQAVFAADAETLRAARGNALLEPILGRGSLLLSDGEAHAERRAVLLPAFRADRMPAYARRIVAATERHTAGWRSGDKVSIQRTALAISREVILRGALGLDEETADALAVHVEDLMAVVGTNAPFAGETTSGVPAARLRSARGALVEALRAAVAARCGSRADQDDVIALLSRARSAVEHGSEEEAIYDPLVTTIFAGHETTASAIAWAIVSLLENPPVLERLLAEIDAARGSIADEDLGSLPFLQATCLEVLRVHPVVPVVSREVVAPFRLGDDWLPPGAFVTPSAHLAHRRADSFPDPAELRPERFLGRRYPAHVYFPFGGGLRRCLGMGFALLEMQIVVGALLRAFRFRPAWKTEPRSVRRAVTLVPSGGARVLVERRCEP